MKSLQLLKSVFVLYLCLSQVAINCAEVAKVNRLKKKVGHKHKGQTSRHQTNAKFAAHVERVTAAMNSRVTDKNVSQALFDLKVMIAENKSQEELQNKLNAIGQQIDNSKDASKKEYIMSTFNNALRFSRKNKKSKDDGDNEAPSEHVDKITDDDATPEEKITASQEMKAQIAAETTKVVDSNPVLKAEAEADKPSDDEIARKEFENFKKNINDAISDSMPDKFCWRRTSTLPKGCPSDYPERSMALCYQTCQQRLDEKSGVSSWSSYQGVPFEKDWANVCYEQCPARDKRSGDCKTWAFMIKRKGSWWYKFKKSFIPKSITNFNDKVTCPEFYKKTLAHCTPIASQNCDKIGYQTCGIGACAINSTYCTQAIFSMVFDTVFGLLKLTFLILAPGAGTLLQTIQKVIGWVQKVFQMVKNAINLFANLQDLWKAVSESPKLRARTIAKAQEKAKRYAADYLAANSISDSTLNDIVSKVYTAQEGYLDDVSLTSSTDDILEGLDGVAEQRVRDNESSATTSYAAYSTGLLYSIELAIIPNDGGSTFANLMQNATFQTIFNVGAYFDIYVAGKAFKKMYDKKSQGRDYENDVMPFLKSVTTVISDWDPTGLSMIARAFMYNQCDVSGRRRFHQKKSARKH